MKIIDGSIVSPKGFLAAGVEAGIKKEGILDMAMVYSKTPCVVAGTFTTNVVKAAPVLWDREIVTGSQMPQVLVVNSGIANAATGQEGYGYCKDSGKKAAQVLGEKFGVSLSEEQVLVASTGVIGKQLPMDKLLPGIEKLGDALTSESQDGHLAAKAIMTTDTRPKEVTLQLELGGVTCTISGMCKGSGMIHPNMCTMLSFVTTDVNISKEMLQQALSTDVCDTYNMISVDGDTSTNDTVLVLANGQAGNPQITGPGPEYDQFLEALHVINETQAKNIAGDGEGATALFEVTITGAADKEQARKLARSVVSSSLTKAAIYGHDANWGRLLCAMGYSGAQFDPEKVSLWFESDKGKILIAKDGVSVDFDEEEATGILTSPKIRALVELKQGEAAATAWGCDLTYDYVKINADYRS